MGLEADDEHGGHDRRCARTPSPRGLHAHLRISPSEHAERLDAISRVALECLGKSDALYHNVEHTLLVTPYHGSVWWRAGWACDSRLRDERSALNGWDRATGRDRRDGHGATPAGPA